MTRALPDPLVPAEVDLRDFQYMELDVQMLRDSRFAAEVDAEAFRAGVLLWCAAWHQVPAGSLPNNDIELSNLAGYGRVVKEWKKVRAQALSSFVECSDGRLYHPIVAEKANAAWGSKLLHHFERAKDRLRKVNKARASENKQPLPELSFEVWNQQRIGGGIPMEKADASAGIPASDAATSAGIPPENVLRGNGEGTERERNGDLLCKPPSESGPPAAAASDTTASPPVDPPGIPPEPPDLPPEAPARGSRLPDDWALPKAWGDWAIAEYPHWTPDIVRLVAEVFAGHWRAKTGKDATKRDWRLTWQNWCRSGITQRDYPPPKATVVPASTDARNAEAMRLLGIAAPCNAPTEMIDG